MYGYEYLQGSNNVRFSFHVGISFFLSFLPSLPDGWARPLHATPSSPQRALQGLEMPGSTSTSTPQNMQSEPAAQVTHDSVSQPPRQTGNSTPADTGDFDMVTDFDTNMDTAGDALADYTAGDDLLDESAFGDAFHHHEHEEDMS